MRAIPEVMKFLISEDIHARWLSYMNPSDALQAEHLRSLDYHSSGLPLSADPREHRLEDSLFILYCKRRLYLPIIDQERCCELCQEVMDVNFLHPFRCKRVGRNTVHHPQVVQMKNIFVKALRGTDTTVHYEYSLKSFRKEACPHPNPRADIVLRNPVTGENTIVDLTFPIGPWSD
jgi:hypothetical protein